MADTYEQRKQEAREYTDKLLDVRDEAKFRAVCAALRDALKEPS